MKILLTGAGGQLGTELRPLFSKEDEVIATDLLAPSEPYPGFRTLDLGETAEVKNLLDQFQPRVIVNAAAYTQVDQAESDQSLAMRINADAPGLMAEWAAANDAFLMHYSTDYVFSGKSQQPYLETDEPSPVNFYGQSKLAGEQAVAAAGGRHVILRTAWIYSSHGKNFLRTMLRLGSERDELSIVNDQLGCPTWARNLARVSLMVIEKNMSGDPKNVPLNGLYHYCDSPPCSWYDFAGQIFEAASAQGLIDKIPALEPVTTDQYPTAAKRPAFSVLDTNKIQQDLRIEPANVRHSVWACLEERNEH